ncbi:unnamed protein product [Dibothriocephalus latus]|uniref:Uncharacterized protein n=1 Tax=Dibothriocephalus latus TaxID=60516 RepID=A0A3P6TUW1_DIBLA|nr:unnamed protein product [Dibothriocephalus latus]
MTISTTNPTINFTDDQGLMVAELKPEVKKNDPNKAPIVVDNQSHVKSAMSGPPAADNNSVGRRPGSEDSEEEEDSEAAEEVESDVLRQSQFLRIRGLSRLYTQVGLLTLTDIWG